jgi:CMP-N-acetylneuraminic acid synthetase
VIFNRRVVAIVPLKAHSERVPEKNIKPFSGKPLFHHILTTLEEVYPVDEVIVDTDGETIAGQARALFPKATVLMRPEELRGDFVSVNKLIANVLRQTKADIYIQTHATNPLLRTETVTEALRAFAQSEEHDSLFTVNRLQTRLYREDGTAINHNPEELLRTQDLPPVFEENSCLYCFTPESFTKHNRRIGEKPMMYETDPIESIDIDDEYTFRLAELLASYAHHR